MRVRVVVAAGFLSFAASAEGAQFIRGDANGDGMINIADPVRSLTFLFLDAGVAPGCLDASDFDDSGRIQIADAIASLQYIFLDGKPPAAPFPFCGDDEPGDDLGCDSFEACYASGGRLVSVSKCKSSGALADAALRQECVEYSWADGILKVRHVNAGFNCCATITAEVQPGDYTIFLEESESGPPCDCLCLYDLEFEIRGIAPMQGSLLLTGSLAGIRVDFDLSVQTSGSYCEERTTYPWRS
jgi:hypothetical protein